MCFPHVDAEFLLGYTISIMSQLDLKSDGAVRLLSEFLGDHTEHFIQSVGGAPFHSFSSAQQTLHDTDGAAPPTHSEVASFARSPFTDVRNWDRFVSYDRPSSSALEEEQRRHGLLGAQSLTLTTGSSSRASISRQPSASRPLSPPTHRDKRQPRSESTASRADRHAPPDPNERQRRCRPPLSQAEPRTDESLRRPSTAQPTSSHSSRVPVTARQQLPSERVAARNSVASSSIRSRPSVSPRPSQNETSLPTSTSKNVQHDIKEEVPVPSTAAPIPKVELFPSAPTPSGTLRALASTPSRQPQSSTEKFASAPLRQPKPGRSPMMALRSHLGQTHPPSTLPPAGAPEPFSSGKMEPHSDPGGSLGGDRTQPDTVELQTRLRERLASEKALSRPVTRGSESHDRQKESELRARIAARTKTHHRGGSPRQEGLEEDPSHPPPAPEQAAKRMQLLQKLLNARREERATS